MHDCAKTQEQLVDLLLGELDPAQARLVAAEAENCADCRREHAALAETLRAFDRASDAALPEESFWAGYHERLREKITAEATGGGSKVLMFRLPGTHFRFTPMQAVAALLVLGALGGGLWMALRTGGATRKPGSIIQPMPEQAGTQTPAPQKEPRQQPVPEQAPQPAPTPIPVINKKTRKNSSANPQPRPRTPKPVAPEITSPLELPLQAASFRTLSPDTLSHFEKAQFMLRTLRNSTGTDAEIAETVAYERQLSRGLLTRNIVLRREAERSGNVPLGTVLNRLEPLLIDIANLPDKPSREEVQAIRERRRRHGLADKSSRTHAAQGNHRHAPDVRSLERHAESVIHRPIKPTLFLGRTNNEHESHDPSSHVAFRRVFCRLPLSDARPALHQNDQRRRRTGRKIQPLRSGQQFRRFRDESLPGSAGTHRKRKLETGGKDVPDVHPRLSEA